MALVGRLDEVSFPEILNFLAMSEKTGRLAVTTGTDEALIVFRRGRIVYAASSAVRETFGSIVTSLGLVTEARLAEALQLQHRSRVEQRLGKILVELGALTNENLEHACQQQVFHVLKEVMAWATGFFRFRPLEIPDHGEVEVDALNLLLERPVEARSVLIDAARSHDEREHHAEPGEGKRLPSRSEPPQATVGSLLGNVPAPTVTAEMVGELLRLASGMLQRGVVLSVRPTGIQGIAQFGLPEGGDSPSSRVRAMRLPVDEPSLLALAVRRGYPCRCRPEHNRWNEALFESLGGPWPKEAVVLPVEIGGRVRLVFYGDNAGDGADIGDLAPLERKLAAIGRLLEEAAASPA